MNSAAMPMPIADTICLSTAATLLGVSKRTVWRRIAEGKLTPLDASQPGEATLIPLSQVLALASLNLSAEDQALVLAAERGDPAAQCDLGLLLHVWGKKSGPALYWLEQAAQQFYPGALYWLGRCYLLGEGVQQDDSLGLRWLEQAAACGHPLAQQVLPALHASGQAQNGSQ